MATRLKDSGKVGMRSTERLTISIQPDLLVEVNELLRKDGPIPNRSEFIRRAIIAEIERVERRRRA
jgi:metal-responsive CopG/Arc/MetJ family transcriptional regulator